MRTSGHGIVHQNFEAVGYPDYESTESANLQIQPRSISLGMAHMDPLLPVAATTPHIGVDHDEGRLGVSFPDVANERYQ